MVFSLSSIIFSVLEFLILKTLDVLEYVCMYVVFSY